MFLSFVWCSQKRQEFATDVSIPPGGTEELDTEVFMGVVNKHITEVGLAAVK